MPSAKHGQPLEVVVKNIDSDGIHKPQENDRHKGRGTSFLFRLDSRNFEKEVISDCETRSGAAGSEANRAAPRKII